MPQGPPQDSGYAHHPQPYPQRAQPAWADPAYGMPPTAPPGRVRKRITAAVAAVTVAAGALTLTACGPGDDKKPAAQSAPAPSGSGTPFDAPAKGSDGSANESARTPIPSELAMAWTAPAVTDGEPYRRRLAAVWQTDARIYIGRGTGVQILDAATGKVTGTVAPPSPGLGLCGMTEGLTKSGLGAVAWTSSAGKYGECDTVSLVDTAHGGTTVWSTTAAGTRKDGSPFSNGSMLLGFVGDDLLAVMTPNTVVGLRTADKSVAWTWKDPPTTTFITNSDMRTSSDRVLVLMTEDRDAGGDHDFVTAALDASGTQLTPQATKPRLNPKDRVFLLSASPMTAIVRPEALDGKTPPRLQQFDRDGAPGKDFPLSGSFGNIQVVSDSQLDLVPRWPLAVTSTMLYGFTQPSGPGPREAQVVAFDLATGAPKWNRPASKSSFPVLLSADDGAVRVLDATQLGDMTIRGFAASDGQPAGRPSTIRIDDKVPGVIGRVFAAYNGRVLMTDTSSSVVNAVLFRG